MPQDSDRCRHRHGWQLFSDRWPTVGRKLPRSRMVARMEASADAAQGPVSLFLSRAAGPRLAEPSPGSAWQSLVVVAIAVAAALPWGCGGPTTPQATTPQLLPPPPPAPGDPAADGAPYLAMVAARLAPEWLHFLEDCRLRLAPTHELNNLSLMTRAELVVDRAGRITPTVLPSGNRDFDAAITDVIAAIGPLPAPPTWLLSDDDSLRLSWRFARDERQASALGAAVIRVEQPAGTVVDARLASGDIGGAARRVARLEDGDPQLREQSRRVFIAALAEGLAGDGQVQRAAVDAVRRAGLSAMAVRLVPLAAATDPALRALAVAALAALADPATQPTLLEQLIATRDPMLASALSRALQSLGANAATEAIAVRLADGDRAAQLTAMAAFAELPVSPAVSARVNRWSLSRDPAVRGALCGMVAKARIATLTRWEIIGRGLDDRDGSARAACTLALGWSNTKPQPWMRAALRRSVDDRDQRVRAAAITSLMRWEPARLDDRLPALMVDSDPVVRAATVAALSRRGDVAGLRGLLADPDPGVRRTAGLALVRVDGLAVRDMAIHDIDPRVRMVALEAKQDLPTTLKALVADESAEVRTEVEVLRVTQQGESLQTGMVRLAGADPATLDRVRIALAWLLAT
jgi:HEAT repeats